MINKQLLGLIHMGDMGMPSFNVDQDVIKKER
jgi:hypothetical protein